MSSTSSDTWYGERLEDMLETLNVLVSKFKNNIEMRLGQHRSPLDDQPKLSDGVYFSMFTGFTVSTAYNEPDPFTCTEHMSLVNYNNVVTNETSEFSGPVLETTIKHRQLITLKAFVKQLKGSVRRMLCRYRLCMNGDPESYVNVCPSMCIQPITSTAYDRVDGPL